MPNYAFRGKSQEYSPRENCNYRFQQSLIEPAQLAYTTKPTMELENFLNGLSLFNFRESLSIYEEKQQGKFLVDLKILPELRKNKCLDTFCRGEMSPSRSARHDFGVKFTCNYCSKSVWKERKKEYVVWKDEVALWEMPDVDFLLDKVSASSLLPLLDLTKTTTIDFYAFLREISS